MKQKTKQLQSSGETRKTNRTWHFLSTLNSLLLSKLLLLLIIPAIGSTAAWAATESISWAITTNSLNIAPTITPSEGAHLSNASTTIELTGFSSTSSQKDGYCKPFYNTVEAFDATTKFAQISFVVADGYTFTPTSLGMTVFSYGTGSLKYKVVISDSKTIATSVTSNEIQPSQGNEAAITFADGAFTGKTFEGKVTIKLYAYNFENTGSGKKTYIKSPITISGTTAAKTSEEPYTVTFNAGAHGTYTGGDITEGSAGAGITLPALTTLADGYIFNGWFTAATSGEKAGNAGATYHPSADTPLYAQYVAKTTNDIRVTPSSGNLYIGKTLNISSYVLSSSDGAITYSSSDESVATVNSSGVITPKKAGSATITVNQAEGTTYLSGSTSFTVTVLAAPTQYTVNLAANNDSYGSVSAVYGEGGDPYNGKAEGAEFTSGTTVSYGTKLTITATPKSGYHFDNSGTDAWGTATDATDNPLNFEIKDGKTFTAKFVADAPTTYSVTYDGNGNTSGSVPTDDKAYTSGNSVTVETNSGTLAKTGYNFAGWNTRSDGTGTDYEASGSASFSITANTTLYAKWTANTYSVRFNANEGSGSMSDQDFTYGVAQALTANAFTRTNYTFAGWNTASDGTGTNYTDGQSVSNLSSTNGATVNLYAKWVDASSSYTPFDLSSADAVINFSESKWSDATALFNAANAGNGVNTPINNVVFRGQTSGGKKAFTISDGKLVMDVGNGQSGNRWFAIPLTNINGRIDVYIKTPYAKGTSFSVKAVLDKGTTTVGTSATNLNAVKLDYVDNYFGTGEGAFHFRIKDLAVSEGVLYIGRNGSSWTTIEKIEVSTLAAGNLIKAPGKIIVGDGNTATVTIKNNSATKTMKLVSQPSYVNCTFSPSSGELIVTPTAIGSGKNIIIALEDDSSPVSIPVEVKGITSVSNLTSKVYEYGANADELSVTADKSSSLGKYTYTWYKNTVNSTTGGVVVKTESNTSNTTSTYTPSTTLAAEDASFYYCEVSVPGDTIQTKTSNVAYVLTSSTGRYFQMSNVAGNKTTSEVSLVVTGQKVAGGEATYYKGSSDGKYVLRFDNYPHYFHSSNDSYFEIQLPTGTTLAATDVVSVTVNAIDGSQRGVRISADADFSTGYDFTTTNNESTLVFATASTANLTGANKLYVCKYGSKDGYFTDLIIYTPGTVKITDPASQTIQSGEVPTPLTVTASDGSGNFSFQWQKKVGDGDWTNVTTPTDGTVDTDGATSTFRPVALTATTSYKCTVTDITADKSATSEAAVITVNAYSHGYYTPSFGDSNTVIYVLNKTNYDGQNKTGTDRGSDTNYWQYTGSVGFETQTIKDISVDAAKYMKIKSGASITFDVKGATAFVIYAGNGNNTSRTFDIKVDGTKVGTQIQNLTWGNLYAINQSGSRITITNANGDIFIDAIKFFKRAPAIITIKKDNVAVTEATQYRADGAVDYAVETNSGGTFDTPTSSNSSVATATYSDGVLTVTPVGKGTATITLHQNAETGAGATYIENDAKLIVNVKNYAVNMSFSYTSVEIKKSDLTAGNSIASSKLPTLTITHEDGTPNAATIKWLSDETSIATVPANTGTSTDYTVTYGSRGLSGGVRIYAYVEDTDKYGSASAYFDLVVKDGTPNKFEKAGESITVQQQYTLDNTSGAPVVTITYGGYKYLKDKTAKWSNTAVINKNHDYSIDGYKYYSSYEKDDATAEYTYKNKDNKDRYYNLKGMRDDWNANSMDSDGETPADAYPDGMWYKKGEEKPQGGNYAEYERIRPLALPCRGSYLKFEPKKSGVLTAYVVQNGVIGRGDNSNQLASKPRLGYWFDQDGWVQQPTVEPVAKQPILKGNGIDSHVFEGKNLREQMTTYWTSANDDDDMITLLTNKWINVAKPNRTNVVDPNTHFSNADTKPDGYYDNPYYWGTNEEVKKNLDKIPAPTNITPVPYHNGYLVPEKCYVKYTLNVVAGKTYYFYGMMTKVGYVGLNFVEAAEDGTGALTTSGFEDFSHETRRLDLKADDDWSTIFGTGEGSKLKNGENTIYDEVTLPSHYRANKWNTICLPFALSENQVEAAFGKGTQLAIYNGLRHDTDKHIYYVKYLRHVDQNILPGQPYLIYPTGTDVAINDDGIIGSVIDDAPDTNKRISFSNVVVEKDKLNQTTANYGNNKDVDGVTESFRFTPTYSPVELEKYSLFYSPTNGKLYRWIKDGGTFATYRAYMKPNSDEVKANSLSFGFSNEDIENTWEENGTDGQETSVIIIEEIGGGQTMISNTSNGKAYNMMGQEVDPTSAKGIVIINGKKYMFN